MTRYLLLIFIFCSFTYANIITDSIERRKDQYSTSPGYFIIPAPYKLPGIGSGFMAIGALTNIKKTESDLFVVGFTGDAQGWGLSSHENYIIDKRLFFDVAYETVSKASIKIYNSRGMNTGENDFNIIETNDSDFFLARSTLSFYERRLEVYGYLMDFKWKVNKLKDSNDNVVSESEGGIAAGGKSIVFGVNLDITDDKLDPRKGVRLDVTRSQTINRKGSGSKYYLMDYSLSGYVPVGKSSTWAFNYFRSDAVVTKKGITDRVTIQNELGLSCLGLSGTDLQSCEAKIDKIIDDTVAENTYGTSTPLGGRSRLRSFPEYRFIGAHTQFLGTEFRWNLNSDPKPFDIFFMKDIRTVIQLAFFHELGQVSDNSSFRRDKFKSSTGAGLRLTTASGLIYRFDGAYGDEGFQITTILNYPWEMF
jgi:outer membrane protein assembly factor BamA